MSTTTASKIVSPEEWLRARQALLVKEKELTHLSDDLARQRQKLPRVRIEKEYVFTGPAGKVTLADLFAGRSQLATYHFMFGPDWEEGCPGCSYLMDHLDGTIAHLTARDVTLVAISRGPLEKLLAFRKRMGWHFPWYSSAGSDFNRDFHVSFAPSEVKNGEKLYNFGTTPAHGEENPGLSYFEKDSSGTVYHTYSTYGRGLDALVGTYVVLDRAPKGRDEDNLDSPMSWVRHHDKYAPTVHEIGSCSH
ncbi:MAG TPA: thioredoxin family protein [Pirellulales bacterium]|nr:thioredoxin family protein [Pirellulales bacterium]